MKGSGGDVGGVAGIGERAERGGKVVGEKGGVDGGVNDMAWLEPLRGASKHTDGRTGC